MVGVSLQLARQNIHPSIERRVLVHDAVKRGCAGPCRTLYGLQSNTLSQELDDACVSLWIDILELVEGKAGYIALLYGLVPFFEGAWLGWLFWCLVHSLI